MSFLLKDKTSTPVPSPNNFFRESKEINLKNKINKHKTSSLSMCDVFVVIIFTVLAIYCNGWLDMAVGLFRLFLLWLIQWLTVVIIVNTRPFVIF